MNQYADFNFNVQGMSKAQADALYNIIRTTVTEMGFEIGGGVTMTTDADYEEAGDVQV
jgi:methylmalonyl-CoA mutase N-terminal domain/subunit